MAGGRARHGRHAQEPGLEGRILRRQETRRPQGQGAGRRRIPHSWRLVRERRRHPGPQPPNGLEGTHPAGRQGVLHGPGPGRRLGRRLGPEGRRPGRARRVRRVSSCARTRRAQGSTRAGQIRVHPGRLGVDARALGGRVRDERRAPAPARRHRPGDGSPQDGQGWGFDVRAHRGGSQPRGRERENLRKLVSGVDPRRRRRPRSPDPRSSRPER